MPKLTKLTVKERINVEAEKFVVVMFHQSSRFMPLLYVEIILGFISKARWELFGYHESSRSLPFEVVITVDSVMKRVQVRFWLRLHATTCV